ncbi:MAG: nuclear transport factor 2 family protein [Nevskia sp.]|nr:nuclear transport factor 2 family protein [Nevskia sp.]
MDKEPGNGSPATLERRVWELQQRELITETLVNYCMQVDRNDPAQIVEQVFCEDGCFELGERHAVVGHDNLRLMFAKTLAAFSATSHHLSNVVIRFTGEASAEATAYIYAWHLHAADGHRIDLWGRYQDRLALTPKGWRISRRRLLAAGSDGWENAPFGAVERLPNPAHTPSPAITRR